MAIMYNFEISIRLYIFCENFWRESFQDLLHLNTDKKTIAYFNTLFDLPKQKHDKYDQNQNDTWSIINEYVFTLLSLSPSNVSLPQFRWWIDQQSNAIQTPSSGSVVQR